MISIRAGPRCRGTASACEIITYTNDNYACDAVVVYNGKYDH